MRFAVTVILALLLWGYASFSAGNAGISRWIPAVCLVFVGLIGQLIYARLVNRHFDAVGMPEIARAGLKDDRGVVPIYVAVTGIAARSLLIAGSIMPLLEVAGCIVPGKVGIAS